MSFNQVLSESDKILQNKDLAIISTTKIKNIRLFSN